MISDFEFRISDFRSLLQQLEGVHPLGSLKAGGAPQDGERLDGAGRLGTAHVLGLPPEPMMATFFAAMMTYSFNNRKEHTTSGNSRMPGSLLDDGGVLDHHGVGVTGAEILVG